MGKIDFKITKERRAVWDVELDIFAEFKRICEKHDIKYFAFGGTMLGAIQYKGFIPWDDDIDIAMLREEYEKLCKVAQEFKEPYYFQTDFTDALYRGHAQLRRSNTTAIMPNDLGRDYNQGIFIDIFPVDEYPATPEELARHRKKVVFYTGTMRNRFYNATSLKQKVRRVIAMLVITVNGGRKRMFKKLEREASRYNGCGNGIVGALTVNYGKEADYMEVKDLKKLKNVAFDKTTIPMPLAYDKILTQHFGDYKTPIQAPNTHGDCYFSTKIAYPDFIKGVKNGSINPEDYYL